MTMTSEPAVSVLMTAYNRERYIAAAIESVLVQTFADFELIVVDDCSTDRTVAVAERYASADSRVRVVRNERNLGDYPNRNRAASFARGRYMKYHDSDDVMYPYCLGTLLALLANSPGAAAAVTVCRNWPGGPAPMRLTPALAYRREYLGMGLFVASPSCGLFDTEMFRDIGGFPEVGVASDWHFWSRLCARHDVVLAPGDLFWYRIHSGQEIRSDQAVLDYARLWGGRWLALMSADCPLSGDDLERAKRSLVWDFVKLTLADLRARAWRPMRARFQSSPLRWCDWLRYLRRERRGQLEGTPFGADGDYLVPDPSCFRLPGRFAEAGLPEERQEPSDADWLEETTGVAALSADRSRGN